MYVCMCSLNLHILTSTAVVLISTSSPRVRTSCAQGICGPLRSCPLPLCLCSLHICAKHTGRNPGRSPGTQCSRTRAAPKPRLIPPTTATRRSLTGARHATNSRHELTPQTCPRRATSHHITKKRREKKNYATTKPPGAVSTGPRSHTDRHLQS